MDILIKEMGAEPHEQYNAIHLSLNPLKKNMQDWALKSQNIKAQPLKK